MFAATHAFLSMAAAAGVMGISDPVSLGIAAIASQLPDVDTTTSLSGRVLWPISNWIEQRYPHRSATHSFVATGAIAIAALPLGYWGQWHWWGCAVIGYFVGWLADSYTRAGVEAFWPDDARLVIPGNPRARLRSGSKAEYWILAMATIATIGLVNLNSSGGISEIVGRGLVLQTSTAAEMLNKYGGSQVVWVEVKGSHQLSGQPIGERLEVLEAMGSNVLAMDSEGKIYQVGQGAGVQIYAQRVKSTLGEPLTTQYETQAPREVGADEWIRSLPKTGYISGRLAIDDVEEVLITKDPEQYPRVEVSGTDVLLTWATRREVWEALRDFWILEGDVIIRERIKGPA